MRDALVAEVLAELVDLLETAHDQALEVELGCDPQVQVAVERVVVGDEGPGESAAVEGLQDRRLDLEEAALVEEAANRRHEAASHDEELARLLVGEQVELAPPVAGLDVRQAVVLVGGRPKRLREQRPAVDAHRELAPPGPEGCALDADEVAEVEADQPLVGVAEHVLSRVELDPPGAVDEVEERRLAVPSPRAQPPGETVGVLGLIAGLEALVAGAARPRSACDPEARRERVDAGLAKLVELLAPLGEQAILVDGLVRRRIGGLHAGEGYRGVRRAPGR